MKKRIGFVGLGLMGRGMVRNLLSAGFPVVGYDIDPGKMEALTGKGFQKSASPEALPGMVDMIILSLIHI
ncbi:MAG: 2-hydroxy-3-oxopropionate reductase, partial [Deltaproteobacteria bacterium]